MPDFSSYTPDVGAPAQTLTGVSGNSFGARGDAITPDMQKIAARGVYNPADGYSFGTQVVGDVGFGALDLADTVSSSIPFLSKAAGVQRGDLNNTVLDAIGMPGLRDFYEANQGGIHAASGIMGIVAADLATGGLAGAAPVAGLLSKVSWGRKALALDTEYQNAKKAVNVADEVNAGRGLMGSKLFTSEMGITGASAAADAGLAPGVINMSRKALVNRAVGLGFVKGAVRAGATEAVMATTLNQNDFLYSADMGSNLAFAALGLGVGGLIPSIMTKYSIRAYTNSDTMRRVIAGALDPTGQQAALTAPAELDKTIGKDWFGGFQGSRTDRITALYTSARSEAPAAVDKSTFGRLQTQYEKIGQEEVQKVTVKGLSGVDGTGFSTSAPGYGNHIYEMLHRDPGAMLGVEMAGGIGDGMSISGTHAEFSQGIQDQIQKISAAIQDKDTFFKLSPSAQAALINQSKKLDFASKLVPTPVIDGEATTMSVASAFDNWVEPQIKATSGDGLTTWLAHDPTGKPLNIGLDSQGQIFLPGRTNVNTASLDTMLNLYRTAQQRVASLARDPKAVLQLPENPSWFHLDMAESLLQKNPNAVVQYPAGMSRELAQVESFAQKTDAIKATGQTLSGDDAAALRIKFNLPRLSAFEAGLLGTSDTPADVLVRGAIAKGGGDAIRQMSVNDLMTGMDASRNLTDIAGKSSSKADTTMGNTMNFLTDSDGNPVKPMLMYRRPFMQQDWLQDNVAERIAIGKAQLIKNLVNKPSAPMTSSLGNLVASSADTQIASQVQGLSDLQMESSLPGLGGNPVSAPFQRIVQGTQTAEMRARDAAPVLAATRLRESVDRTSQAFMKNLFTSAMGDSLVVLNSPRNRTSKFLLNQFHSFAGGWDLGAKPVKTLLADGTDGYAFPLEDTVQNHQQYQSLYGQRMPDGATLLNPQGKEVQLDEMGLQVQKQFNQITDQHLLEKNALLDSQGLPTISSKPWYTPPADVTGKYVGFTFDATNKIVPGGTVIANTEEQFNRQVAKLSADPESIMNRDGHSFRTQNEVKDFATLMDKAQMDMINPGRTFIQGQKANEGHLLGSQVNLAAFDDSLSSVRNGILQHGRDVFESLMSDSLKAAQARSAISSGEQVQGGRAFGIKDGGKNVFDYYTEAVTGRSPIASDKSLLGGIQARLEAPINAGLRPIASSGVRAWQGMNDYLATVNPFKKTAQAQTLFETLQDKLGENMPFSSVADMMEAKGYGAKPATLKGLAAGTSRFEATWLLRMMEPMQAVMNLTGILNAAPAVVRHLSQQTGEDAAAYASRVGHSANIFTTLDGQSFGILDAAKLAYRGFKRAWSGAADGDWQRLADKGMLSQEIIEFQKAFNAADSRSGWDLFMNGDPTATGPAAAFKKKGVVGWASYLTDKSEDFSRSWAHMIGDDVGQQLGITDTIARDNFAHDVANKMIANYNPLNRPAMFQGAIGTPIGLFQGFIWAYYQRMFRYLETGDMRALATQYATQGASFGLKTVPGFNEVNQMWFNHSDGKNDPYDEIYKRFGQGAGDALMGGVWGNLPRLLGGKAIDLSSRGDTTFRTPVLNEPAIFSTAGKVFKGVGAAISLFSQQNPAMSKQQVAEILSNTIPNRPIANMIEQFGAGGGDTDATGQLVAQSHDWMDTTARVLGTRTMTQSNALEAFYSNKQAMEIRAQQAEDLNRNTRALIRGGDPSKLQDVFETYVANGGDPKHYRAWVSRTMKSAVETRSDRQVVNVMSNPANQAMTDRLLGAQTGITSEAAQADPAQNMEAQDSMMSSQPTNSALDNTDMQYGTGQFAQQ